MCDECLPSLILGMLFSLQQSVISWQNTHSDNDVAHWSTLWDAEGDPEHGSLTDNYTIHTPTHSYFKACIPAKWNLKQQMSHQCCFPSYWLWPAVWTWVDWYAWVLIYANLVLFYRKWLYSKLDFNSFLYKWWLQCWGLVWSTKNTFHALKFWPVLVITIFLM